MVHIYVERQHDGTIGAPAGSLYREILAAHRQTDMDLKRPGKRRTFEASSVSLRYDIEKHALKAPALEAKE